MPELSRKERKERASAVDELHKLKSLFRKLKPKKDRLEFLTELVLSWYPDLAADKTAIAEGAKASAVIGAREFERKIKDKEAIYKKLTHAVFVERCTMPLKVLDELLTVLELAEYVEKTRSGRRTIETVPKAA